MNTFQRSSEFLTRKRKRFADLIENLMISDRFFFRASLSAAGTNGGGFSAEK
jgi:hypothetical protein